MTLKELKKLINKIEKNNVDLDKALLYIKIDSGKYTSTSLLAYPEIIKDLSGKNTIQILVDDYTVF